MGDSLSCLDNLLSPLISKKAKLPNAITFLGDFNLSGKELQQVVLFPHKVALDPYVRAFQYKVLNRILYQIELKRFTKLASFHTKIVLFAIANQKL